FTHASGFAIRAMRSLVMVDLVITLTSERNVNEREQPEDELNYSPADHRADDAENNNCSSKTI
ncbi:TPA: hypothetical protein ACNHAH_005397, partial [Klebsiella pneumoniae]